MKIAKRIFLKVLLVVGALLVTVYVSSGGSGASEKKDIETTSAQAEKDANKKTTATSNIKELKVETITPGLTYTIDKTGDAKQAVAKSGKKVSVHYTGWLKNSDGTKGKQFDSSKTRGVPFEFVLGAGYVIKGWDMGVEGMQKGEVRTLTIAPQFGYGSREIPGAIPANSTLIFEVEFLG